jgi:hypothetical protein
MALLRKAFIRRVDSGWQIMVARKLLLMNLVGFSKPFMKVAVTEKAVNGFRNIRICPLNPDFFTEEDFLPADLEVINVEDPEPENEPTGVLPPPPDVMTNSPLPSSSVTRNLKIIVILDCHVPSWA